MARTAVANAFIPNPILLLGEGEGHKRCRSEIGFRAREVIEGPRADLELHVLHAKHVGTLTCGVAQVFASA